MSGTRRARALVSAIQSTLGTALALADRLDEQAERLASGPPGPTGALPAAGAAASDAADELPPGGDLDVLGQAAELTRAQTPGLAGASWTSPAWSRVHADAAGRSGPAGTGGFRPGLWRLGRVVVPPLRAGDQAVEVPLAVPLLDAGNLLIETTRARRAEAVGVVRGLLTRILAQVPPGGVQLTVYDPHELGAGLAAFAPLRAAGVAGPTLTGRARLEAALAELSGQVGRITVERLAGRFDSLREREDSGLPRSEPWRLLVLLGWPALPDEAARLLDAVAAQGPSCGVHVIAVVERPPAGAEPGGLLGGQSAPTLPKAETVTAVELVEDDLAADGFGAAAGGPAAGGPAGSAGSAGSGGRWRTSLTGGFDCLLDDPPPVPLLSAVVERVAEGARKAAERPPDLAGLLPARLWEYDSSAGLTVPVAHGPDGPVTITFDDDTVHALVGGQAGSGKSTLLLDVVYGLAARYGPDQLRFHLLDFKEGLEFAQFARRPADPFFLPHADTVGIESDREFGVAVLRAVREEMQRRSVAMRAAGARDLRGLRSADRSSPWPRVMVVVDEFQVMLTPLDTVAREAVAHLEVLARQGRAYGIHLLLASQTLSGIDALDATSGKRGSIFGQFALRIALRTSISESRVLLSTANEAAGALAAVGEAIVNRRNGHPAGNEHVRVAYPEPAVVQALRGRLAAAAATLVPPPRPPRVFVGTAPAVLTENPAFQALSGRPAPPADGSGAGGALSDGAGLPEDTPWLPDPDQARDGGDPAAGTAGGPPGDPLAFVGVPLDLAPLAVGVRLAPLPGRHLAVLGPARREAVGMLQAAALSVGAQTRPGQLAVDIVAADPSTAAAADVLAEELRRLGHPARVTDVTGLREVLAAAAGDIRAREEAALAGRRDAAAVMRLVVVFAMDVGRAAMESRDETSRRSGLDDLRILTRRGPATRVHLLAWWRAPSRLAEDLGPVNRDDIAAWVSAGLPGSDLFGLAGHRPVNAGTTPNRAVLFDRHAQADPRTVVPFAPLGTR